MEDFPGRISAFPSMGVIFLHGVSHIPDPCFHRKDKDNCACERSGTSFTYHNSMKIKEKKKVNQRLLKRKMAVIVL